MKKDSLDLKLDTSRQTLHAARAKPKLNTTHSEGSLTVFANGHHKPCHRNNNTAHNSGLPYKISRPHTLHGAAAFGATFSPLHTSSQAEQTAQRAVDTHSVSNNDYHAIFGSAPRGAVDSLPLTPITASLESANGFQDSFFSSQSTDFGFGSASPEESQSVETMSAQQWPWAINMEPVNRVWGYGSLSTSPSQDCLPNLDNDWAIPSAGLSNQSWSATDLPLDPSKLNDQLAQPISHSGESNKQSNPGMTTASSSHSETGEPVMFGDFEVKNPPSVASESLFWDDTPSFRFANSSAPTDFSFPPASSPAFVENGVPKDVTSMPTSMPISNSTDRNSLYSVADFSALSMPNSVNDISIDPWSSIDQNMFCNGFEQNQNFPSWI